MTVAIPPGQMFSRRYKEPESSGQPSREDTTTEKVGIKPENSSTDAMTVTAQTNGDAAGESTEGTQQEALATEEETCLGNFESGWAGTLVKGEIADKDSISFLNESGKEDPDDRKGSPVDDSVVHEIKNLKQLNDKIIEIDGRLDPKDLKQVPAVSPWKLIRAKRNNQDLGTLFEMREDFYVYKLPHITKAKKK